MPLSCAVVDCKTRMYKKNEGVHLFCFPREKSRYNPTLNNILVRRKEAWIRALKRGKFTDEQINKMRICSLHFIEGKPAKFQQVNHPDWTPTLNLGYWTNLPPANQRLLRYKRREKNSLEIPVKKSDYVPVNSNRTVEIEINSEPIIEEEIECVMPTIIDEEELEFSSTTVSIDEEYTQNTLPNICTSSITGEQETEISPSNNFSTSISPAMLQLKIELQKAEIQTLKMELERLKLKLQSVNDEAYNLREKVKKYSYCEEAFVDEKKLLFYTGIPHIRLFNIILKHLNLGSINMSELSNSLHSFQILLLVLMKLRLSSSFRSLGYKFDISKRAASTIFRKGIILMYNVLYRFIHWPSREELLNSAPQCFSDTFGKRVAVIIDYFEIAIQKPELLEARAVTFSQCKQKSTVKYLIGIAPCGAVIFISEGWGGSASDEHITENSELSGLLEPGDVILADRGFTVCQEVGLRYATLNTPEFSEGKPQLSPQAIEDSTKVSSLRIHVEKVIRLLRNKFKFLNGPIPITLLNCKHDGNNLLDYIVTVCYALINMCDSVVSN